LSTSNNNKQQPTAAPSYSRSHFTNVAPQPTHTTVSGVKGKPPANMFDDILSSHGFSAQPGNNANKTLANMKRVEEIRDMDPTQIKVVFIFIHILF
jgi:hypothetical protein